MDGMTTINVCVSSCIIVPAWFSGYFDRFGLHCCLLIMMMVIILSIIYDDHHETSFFSICCYVASLSIYIYNNIISFYHSIMNMAKD